MSLYELFDAFIKQGSSNESRLVVMDSFATRTTTIISPSYNDLCGMDGGSHVSRVTQELNRITDDMSNREEG